MIEYLCNDEGAGLREGLESLAVFALVAALLFVGCGRGAEDSGDETVHFHPLERESRTVSELEPPDPSVALSDHSDLRKIVEGFRRNASEFFRRDAPDRPVDEVERIFMSSGKYLELTAIYQEVVDEQGLGSPAAPRLAWLLVRLGQQQQARQLIDRLLEKQPEDPFTHFVDGAYWFNRARESREATARAAIAWRKVLELDPSFQGPNRLNASGLRRKVAQIERRLPASPEKVVAAASGERADEPPGSGAATGSPSERGADAGGRVADDTGVGGDDVGAAEPDTSKTPDAGVPEQTSARDAGAAHEPGRTPTPVLVTRADLALSSGNREKARDLYLRVLRERDRDHLEATFGILRVAYRKNPHKASIPQDLRELASREDLTAKLAYEMGLFARAKLGNSELAERFWKRVRELDPEYAEQVGVGAE